MASPPSLPERRPESPISVPAVSAPSPAPPAAALPPAAEANPFDDQQASPPPATTAQAPHPAPAEQTEAPADPRVAALKAMFPDFDDQILLSVLESANGSQDRAIDMLLGMSDPEYKAQNAPEATAARPQTQEDLDAEFARRLMLEEQEANDRAAAMYYDQQQSRHEASGWQPQARTAAGGNTTSPSNGNDTMSDIQAQVKQFGETGLKTINSLFSKVKAKIQELDTNNGGASGSQAPQQQQQQQQAPWGASPNANYQPYRRSQESSARRSHEAAAAHYDDSEPIRLGDPPASSGAEAAGRSSQGYDVSPSPSPAPRPTSRSSRPIDGGKLGILPKRPVSLVRDASPKPDDDDELEYAENPFETEDKGVKAAK
ncbi:hypothetical protein HDZ31DRAFT_62237 [Schizophyllum fasciatum]